jgi:hypothetical protein
MALLIHPVEIAALDTRVLKGAEPFQHPKSAIFRSSLDPLDCGHQPPLHHMR